MNRMLLLTAGAVVSLSGCVSAPPTSWGKANVTKVDYGTDIGMCTGIAAQRGAGNQANTAGGTSGATPDTRSPTQGEGASTPAVPSTSSAPSNTPANLPTGTGMYQSNTPQEVVQRAANQQQAEVMAAKRARADAYRSCLVNKGYSEFTLTAAQSQHLATLKTGSNEYHEYLYSLGKDASVLKSQAAAPAATP